jgi:restriction endonuclease S subunit
LLEQYKKGVMQQLFSGKLRFKDENGNDYGDWEEKKLGDVCEMTSSKRVYLNDYVKEGIPFYRGKEISELRLNQLPSDLLYISKERYEDFKSKYGVPLKNDILITAVGTLGNILRIRNDDAFYFKDGNLIWLRNISESAQFLEITLQWETKELIKTSIGSTQKALTMVELRKLSFNFPSKEEQQKIATFLSSIDIKIESTNQQITQTQSFKKGLLQQMFV